MGTVEKYLFGITKIITKFGIKLANSVLIFPLHMCLFTYFSVVFLYYFVISLYVTKNILHIF